MVSSDFYLCPLLTGTGYLTLVPSHLPYLRRLNLEQCNNVCDKYLKELVNAAPELEVIDYYGERVLAAMI
jgi:hypothetical protein